MKKEKRHISFEKQLIIVIIISVLSFVVSLYIYNNYLVGQNFKDNILLFIVGIVVGLIIIASILVSLAFIGILFGTLLSNYYEKKEYLKSKEEIKVLPNDFVTVYLKNSNDFPLATFVASEDITCYAKLDENGKVVYKIQINAEYETDNYNIFLRHFKV